MHIILFGASFDPPHLGHELVAKTLIEKQISDEVWFVPCSKHAFAKPLSPAEDRLAMLELISIPHTRIETYELHQEGVSYSFNTLRHFQSTQPQHRFSWVLGSDLLPTFSKWYQYEELLNSFTVYVYPRPKFPLEPLLPGMVALHQVPEIVAYSTEIRDTVKEGKSIDGLVNPMIAKYINKHSLYK